MLNIDELKALYETKATLADFYRAALHKWRNVPDAVPEGALIELRKRLGSDAHAGRALAEYYGLVGGREQKNNLARACLEEFIFNANPAAVASGDPISERWAQAIRYNKDGDVVGVQFPNKVDAVKCLLDLLGQDKRAEILDVIRAIDGESEDDAIKEIKNLL